MACSPPTSTVIWPECARCTPPVTGHSSTSMPLALATSCKRCRSFRSVVLISIQIPPGARCSNTPPGPSTTLREAATEGNAVMTRLATLHTPATSSAQWAPALSRRCALSLRRSVTVTWNPLLTRLLHRGSPRLPRPMKAILKAEGLSMFELVEDEVNICEHDLRWCTPTGWHTAARGVCAVCRIAGTKTNAQSRGIRLALLMRNY